MQNQPIRHAGPSSSHFHLPFQMLLGLLFMATGSLLLLKKIGQDYIPFISEDVMVYVCGIGSVMGGFYLIMSKLYRPRIYFQ